MPEARTQQVKLSQPKTLLDRVPRPPVFATLAEERRHRKERLAASFRLFSRYGFDEGGAGHITARDPERLDHFWVNPFGMHFSQIRVSDLILVNDQGEVVDDHPEANKQNHREVNLAAFAIHSRIHKARPDVVAAAHAHSLYGKSWSSLGRLLDPLTQDACAFYEDHVIFDDYTGIVEETSEGDRIARALGTKKAAILLNHGLLTVGQCVDEAVWWFITMDRSCHAQLLAEAAGQPRKIPHETARHTYAVLGSPLAGWFQFQPLYDRIIRDQPDLFE
jgi:ribulose-5-phosphate 4-epimerase/fuculose-1-phosphate aldolase